MNVNQESQVCARNFIKHCASKFGWGDVSADVIMDVGCGYGLYCGNAILAEYPDVRKVIGIDRDPKTINDLAKRNTKIKCYLADIEKRHSLERFLGKMTKVFSYRVFHELKDVQTAFQNVYHLLRPGGEAAIMFYSRSSKHEWFVEMIKIPKWKELYQDCFNTDSFLSGISTQQYMEMVKKIGFEVVECSENKTEKPFGTDAACKDKLYKSFQHVFKVPTELLDEFKQEALKVYEKVSERDAKDRLLLRSDERTLLLVKPTDGYRSETRQ